MSGSGQRFDPSELRIPGEPELSVAERADALLAARDLESLSVEGVGPTEGFEDRVMAAIATQAAPRLVVRPSAAVRGGRAGAFLVAVRDSWGVATSGGRPVAVRAQAMAFVLLVVLATGTLASAGAIGVGGLLNPDRGSTPSVTPDATHGPTQPSTKPADGESAEPSETPGTNETAEPSETPEATDTGEPGKTPETETARPRETPRATEKPEPTETPEPAETPRATDDHGGGSGGGGSGSNDGSSGRG